MANLTKVIYINEEDYSTLLNGDSITKGGTTYTYDSTALYVIKNVGAPEYAETAGYATNAGTSLVAITDASGNNIAATYLKKPLVIAVYESDDGLDLGEGTYNSITQALAQNREVILKLQLDNSGDDQIAYIPLNVDYSNEPAYYFTTFYRLFQFYASIEEDNVFSVWSYQFPYNNEVVHKSGVDTITGTKNFTGTVSLGSNATATTPAAGDNDTSVATTAFVQNAVNSLPTPMQFKGSLGTSGTYTSSTIPAAATSNKGWTLKVITDGTYQSVAAKVGDTLISDGSAWILIPSGDEPSGTVTSVTLNATSPIAIDNSAAITTSGSRTISHANSGVTAGTYDSVTVNATGHVTAGTNPSKYWANLQVGTAANYITEPEIKSLKINGSSTNAASTENAVIQYDTTNKCIKFVFN